MTLVHPTAVVDRSAVLADDVVVGPWCVIGPKVTIGAGTILRSHVVIESHTRIGRENVFSPFCTIGGTPQDRKYRGEETWCEIGDRNHIREQVTVHRGTAVGGGLTRVGNGNLFMVAVHVAHDCIIGDEVTIANAVLLAGHVHVGSGSTIGGNACFHHFVTVGKWALVAGLAIVKKDVPPFLIVEGSPARVRGYNQIQMARRGASAPAIDAMRTAYRRLYGERSAAMNERLVELREEFPEIAEIHELCDALQASHDGVHGRALESLRTDDKRSVPVMWQPNAVTDAAPAATPAD